MRRCVAFGLIAGGLTVVLSGCGFFDTEQREPWRAQEEARCLASGAVVPSAYIQPGKELKGPRICGLTYPFKVGALSDGAVPLSSPVPLSCSMVPPLERWTREKVQRAAYMHFGMPVVEILTMGSYNCRPMNHRKGSNWSEHSFANAIDVSGFKLLDGRTLILKKHWKGGTEEEKAFLRDVHGGACEYFNTVLGPGYDALHYDHFHLDMRMHDPRSRRKVCKPVPVLTPSPHRMDPPMVRAPQQPYPGQTQVAQAPRPAPYPAPSLPPASYPQAPAYPQASAYPQPQQHEPYAARLAAAPPIQQGPMSTVDDPIGMWLEQGDPYAVTPGTTPPAVFPQGNAPSGIY